MLERQSAVAAENERAHAASLAHLN
jgi:hypothetical protein